MKVGRLRHQVEIQNYTPTTTDRGETTKAWSEFATVRADVRGITSKEFLQADKASAKFDWVVTTRYLDGVTAKMRLIWSKNGKVLNQIGTPKPDRTDEKMLIFRCVEASD